MYAGMILRSWLCVGFYIGVVVRCMRVRLVGHSAKILDMFLVAQLFFVTGIDFLHLSYTPRYEGSEAILGKDIATLNIDTTLNYAFRPALVDCGTARFARPSIWECDRSL